MVSSMPFITRAVMSDRVCPDFIMSKSKSARILKMSITWSNICLCCAVTHTTDSISSRCSKTFTSGAILIASGRVPKTVITFSFSMLFKPFFSYQSF